MSNVYIFGFLSNDINISDLLWLQKYKTNISANKVIHDYYFHFVQLLFLVFVWKPRWKQVEIIKVSFGENIWHLIVCCCSWLEIRMKEGKSVRGACDEAFRCGIYPSRSIHHVSFFSEVFTTFQKQNRGIICDFPEISLRYVWDLKSLIIHGDRKFIIKYSVDN